MGTIISDQGLKLDPDKLAAITQMTARKNISLLQFTGMLNC